MVVSVIFTKLRGREQERRAFAAMTGAKSKGKGFPGVIAA